ncbi:MAG TPA: HlyD family efflux transporter periplasmic adaptor subunit [Candidatus Krumholzibacterium sp.]|nr:HlyD family efflux transporter periplasmic adaptor subunit [Candidatus Krumholzibacterium sp.]
MDKKIQKKKWTPKKIAYIAGSAALAVLILYTLILGGRDSKLNVRSERITISEVSRGQFQEFIAVTGTVAPIRTHYLDAVEGGRVETVYLEAGSFVNKGDKILKLTNTNLLLDIMYREAELFQQSNNLRNTRLEIARNSLQMRRQLLELKNQIRTQKRIAESNKILVEKALISTREFEESEDQLEYLENSLELTMEMHKTDSLFREAQIEQLEMSLHRMEGNLEIVRMNMENLIIKAPVTGHLTSLNAEIGESKTRGERLGQIDILDGFRVRVSIDEHYIARVSTGQKGSFAFSGETYKLSIDKVYPEVLNGRFEVDMLFEGEEPEDIRRGQTLRIRLELGDLSEATLLATGGFYQKTGGRWVYVLDESGNSARKRQIQLGRENTMFYEVLDGLGEGERVITSSYDNFGDVDVLILKD